MCPSDLRVHLHYIKCICMLSYILEVEIFTHFTDQCKAMKVFLHRIKSITKAEFDQNAKYHPTNILGYTLYYACVVLLLLLLYSWFIVQAFYDVFSDASTGLLDCHSLLLYLCVDPQPREGLCKALTLAVGYPVTSLNQDSVDSEATLLLEDFHKVRQSV